MSCSLAIPFAINNDKYNEIANEFNIIFKQSKDNSLKKLIEFAEAYPDKRINLELEYYDLNILLALSEVHDNIYVKISYNSLNDRDMEGNLLILKELQDNNIKYYFTNFINTLQALDTFINDLKTSEIYIGGDLLYRLPEVREYCNFHNVKIRFIPNVAYTLRREDATNPRTFYMPPDCFEYFEKYFDSIEFFMRDKYDWHEFGVYYRAWLVKRYWLGDLRDIIHNLNIFIPNNSFDGLDLMRYKTICKRKCSISAFCKCRKCEQYIELAQKMNENNLILNKVKKE